MPIRFGKTTERFQGWPTAGRSMDRVALECPSLEVADRVLFKSEVMTKLVVDRPDYFGTNILPATTHPKDRPPEDHKHVRRRRRLRNPAVCNR